jgi:hypothetical protein
MHGSGCTSGHLARDEAVPIVRSAGGASFLFCVVLASFFVTWII